MTLISLPLLNAKSFELCVNDILFIESNGPTSNMHYLDHKHEISTKFINLLLGELEKKLTQFHFFRIHKTTLVNLSKIEPYSSYPKEIVTLKNGISLPLSRRRKLEFHNVFIGFNDKTIIK